MEACLTVRATDYGGALAATIPGPAGVQTVRLTTVLAYFKGTRYYWLCPRCGRRVLLLYLPPKAQRYLCRHCHDLTYRSSQERRRRIAYPAPRGR